MLSKIAFQEIAICKVPLGRSDVRGFLGFEKVTTLLKMAR